MIGDETGHGTEQNLADGCTEVVGHLKQDLAVSRRDGSNKAHGITLIVILAHIAVKEASELPGNHVVDIGAVKMLAQEERVGAQVAGRGGVIEHSVEHLGTRDLVLVKEGFGQFPGGKPLERVAQEHTTQSGTTALITQDEAQRRHVLDDIIPVIEARIAARAQDAGQARLTNQQAASGTQQVAHHRHRRLELSHQRSLDDLVFLGSRAAGTIEIHMTPSTLEELGRQLQPDAVANLTAAHEKRVQTRRESVRQHLAAIDQ